MSLKMQAKSGDVLDIWIYDEIGGFGVTAKDFVESLKGHTNAKTINVHINSPGGDVFDGISIYNTLKKHSAKVITEIDGACLSIASIIALAGDEIKMASNALYMIHNPWAMAVGDAKEMRDMATRLDIVRDSLVSTYKDRIKDHADIDTIISWLDNETWFTASEAKENGFVDEVTNELEMAAKFDLGKFHYKNIPKQEEKSEVVKRFSADNSSAIRDRLAKMKIQVQKNRLNSNAVTTAS